MRKTAVSACTSAIGHAYSTACRALGLGRNTEPPSHPTALNVRSSPQAVFRRGPGDANDCERHVESSHERDAMTATEAPPSKAERWTAQWKELYYEVITTNLCTGCAGCVVT